MSARSKLPRACATVLSPQLRRALYTQALGRNHLNPTLSVLPAAPSLSFHKATPSPHIPSSSLTNTVIVTPLCATALHTATAVLAPSRVDSKLSLSESQHGHSMNLPFSVRHMHSATQSPLKEVNEVLREAATMAAPNADLPQATPGSQASASESKEGEETQIVNRGGQYWRLSRRKLYREDGTEWPWHCFTPADTYRADTKIDLQKHYEPGNFGDTFAKYLVKSLRIPTDLFFQRRYGCRAMMLETVAAVPGMVAGMLLHLKSLRLIEHTGGWIKALLDEAENERMHLMTFMEVAKPRWYERALIFSVQAVFFTCYTGAYIASPRIAHRIVGYLEEEAVHSYTEFLKDIDAGKIENVPAPQIAIDYWRLPKDARLRDVVEVVRADEAHHRDVNHFAADIVQEGKKLKDNPAPVDYH